MILPLRSKTCTDMEILRPPELGPRIQIPNGTWKSVSVFLFVLSCLRTTVSSFKQCYHLYTNKIPTPKMGDHALCRTTPSERKKPRRNSKDRIFWDVVSCWPVNVSRRCGDIFLPLSAGNYLPLGMLYSSTHTWETKLSHNLA